jgi:hypothetical protein
MFELFQLVLSSPLGAYVVAGVQDALYALIVAAGCEECGVNDLGRLLFAGVLAAIIAGVAISILLRRMKDNTLGASGLVSIRPSDPNQK